MATPSGQGGISIVRTSGAQVPTLCEALIGALPAPRYAHLCDFRGRSGEVLDRGLALYFSAPNSYTGEHVLELHGHGSPVVMKMLVGRCFELGARLARPGEFSERAFLNGRIDLAQAEAVADLIESATESAARSAIHALQGGFSSRIHALIDELTELRTFIEATIDFPEEGVDFSGDYQADARVTAGLTRLQQRFAELHDLTRQGKLLRDGLQIVLTGPPNAGKSSLLNALSQQPRAIVSAIPGTTRDVLSQFIELDGLPVEILDTAGIRRGTDEIEVEGVRRAIEAQKEADLILLVVDDATAEEPEIQKLFKNVHRDPTMVCLVRNKIDVSGRLPGATSQGVALSALSGSGITDLVEMIKQRAGFRTSEDNRFIARQRHLDALQRASQHLHSGIEQLSTYHAPELVAEELTECQRVLGEITGQEISSDDLLGMIFASFCIGK